MENKDPNFAHLTDEQLLDEIKRLWWEQAGWELELAHRGYTTAADDYIGSEAEEYIEAAEAAYKARGLELPSRPEYIISEYEDQ